MDNTMHKQTEITYMTQALLQTTGVKTNIALFMYVNYGLWIWTCAILQDLLGNFPIDLM
jgi:hypothetical protein